MWRIWSAESIALEISKIGLHMSEIWVSKDHKKHFKTAISIAKRKKEKESSLLGFNYRIIP
jgi:hypothetical protein